MLVVIPFLKDDQVCFILYGMGVRIFQKCPDVFTVVLTFLELNSEQVYMFL